MAECDIGPMEHITPCTKEKLDFFTLVIIKYGLYCKPLIQYRFKICKYEFRNLGVMKFFIQFVQLKKCQIKNSQFDLIFNLLGIKHVTFEY